MDGEEKAPYFSKRIRIGDVTSPKYLVGYKEFSIELTFGNQDVMTIRNHSDVADTTEKSIFQTVDDIFKERDAWAEKMGFKFVDSLTPKAEPFDTEK